ncbi:MAG: PP2C family protein-serine/threonine phosphatase [Ignavibacteriales bacterium]|nr:PP2C family protein-serine/threonine phosphatase [Ignavibacteriales bacterium]
MDQLSILQGENVRLRKAVEELSLLNDLSRVISSTMSLDVIIDNIIKRAVKAVHCHQGMITLVDEVSPNSMFTLIRTLDSSSNHQQFHLNQNILGWMMINKKPLHSDDFHSDTRFSGVKVEGNIKSILCVPLLIKNRVIGILALFDKKEDGKFTEDDVRLLSIIGTQSAQVLENARLYEQEQKKMAMEKELIAAREVQTALLPNQLPQVARFKFAAKTIPAKEIGGDFYDIIQVHDDVYEIIIADVAGKGLSAALLATLGKGVLCSQVVQHNSLLTQLKLSNHILRGSIPHKSFITLLLAAVEPESRTVTIANAGHCYPLLYDSKSQKVETIQVKGFALNLADEHRTEVKAITMNPDDCLVLYSDGVDEAQNIAQEFFGIERLADCVRKNAQSSADMLLQKIMDEVKIFSKGVSQVDDITLLVVKATE